MGKRSSHSAAGAGVGSLSGFPSITLTVELECLPHDGMSNWQCMCVSMTEEDLANLRAEARRFCYRAARSRFPGPREGG